ncbi:hypothetical protein KKE92_04810 [Candidatus Micrarchaeota archaeon]|nr:hypothetical protein [Candidatus Micrarchaeota archaeon]
MIIGKDLVSGLRKLKEKDGIEINGEKYEVISTEELFDTTEIKAEHETRSKGMQIDLKKAETDAFATHYLMSFMDVEVEYKRTGVFDGPPPLNPNPEILFVQDMEANKTYKYSVTKKEKNEIELQFLKGEEEIGIKLLSIL